MLLSACLLSVTGSSAGVPNPMSLSLMPVSGILSYAVLVLSTLSSVVVCAPILNVLMPPLIVIVGFIPFSTAPVVLEPSMIMLTSPFSSLCSCFLILSSAPIRVCVVLPLVPFSLVGGMRTRHYPLLPFSPSAVFLLPPYQRQQYKSPLAPPTVLKRERNFWTCL